MYPVLPGEWLLETYAISLSQLLVLYTHKYKIISIHTLMNASIIITPNLYFTFILQKLRVILSIQKVFQPLL